eukprot:TRINITY_DN7976_c0_g1_i2.p1 TRINITY_DN7976_c0_g1~~TRINITY_DN7976_c0_g1_i2.p1  ORF type:complete len:295 (+),score=83.39 TRINITY_DN7976_c0_g1_i2:84-887(+)
MPPNSSWEKEWAATEVDCWVSISGLQTKYKVLRPGDGNTVIRGSEVIVHAKGTVQGQDKPFWDTRASEPFKYKAGIGSVIRGWDHGCIGMAIGEVRKLLIPGQEGYPNGFPSWGIPPGATLEFEIEVNDILGRMSGPPPPKRQRTEGPAAVAARTGSGPTFAIMPAKAPAPARSRAQPSNADDPMEEAVQKVACSRLSRGFALLTAAQRGVLSAPDRVASPSPPRSPSPRPRRSPSPLSDLSCCRTQGDEDAPPPTADGTEEEGFDY